MGAGRGIGSAAARLGLRLHSGPPDRPRLGTAAVGPIAGGGGVSGGGLRILSPTVPAKQNALGWAKPTGPAGACHRAGQRPDPLGRPDDKLRVPTRTSRIIGVLWRWWARRKRAFCPPYAVESASTVESQAYSSFFGSFDIR